MKIFLLATTCILCLLFKERLCLYGGYNINIEEAPYQAALYIGVYKICSGALISDEFVLTAAHCCRSDSIKVILGKTTTSGPNLAERGNMWAVDDTIIHPDYDKKTNKHNVALLKLWNKIEKFGETIQPILLAPVGDTMNLTDQPVIVTGWEDDVNYAITLKKIDAKVQDNDVCSDAYSKLKIQITPFEICTEGSDTKLGTCYDDIGGPLVFQRSDGIPILVGSISTPPPLCMPSVPTVYSRISKYRAWIDMYLSHETS